MSTIPHFIYHYVIITPNDTDSALVTGTVKKLITLDLAQRTNKAFVFIPEMLL